MEKAVSSLLSGCRDICVFYCKTVIGVSFTAANGGTKRKVRTVERTLKYCRRLGGVDEMSVLGDALQRLNKLTGLLMAGGGGAVHGRVRHLNTLVNGIMDRWFTYR